jgi:hypothetical protein
MPPLLLFCDSSTILTSDCGVASYFKNYQRLYLQTDVQVLLFTGKTRK